MFKSLLKLYSDINSQNDLFQVHIKIYIYCSLLGLISFESLSDSLQLVLMLIILALKICSFEEELNILTFLFLHKFIVE